MMMTTTTMMIMVLLLLLLLMMMDDDHDHDDHVDLDNGGGDDVGYSDADVQFEWMNRTEPHMDDLDLDAKAIILDKEVALPQFEVKSVEPQLCRYKYHQKAGGYNYYREIS
ncbi:gamma-aminobutyric acid-grated chloride-ion channel/receptor, zeta subunit [Elysia marginata]|uniref:Gamma-aminobutyric acid-grated chloride-ion channel/receptor, zeta subunit n=1 Tax=Elysia marginata TaxID=1093978 RepID=A0AAV4H6B0_9GAST|nr:gamma-aminobutyric acid-grated chloride-ion channel/receptor, zeta subunit [Elysia marginata]